jgi:hypothetical protein
MSVSAIVRSSGAIAAPAGDDSSEAALAARVAGAASGTGRSEVNTRLSALRSSSRPSASVNSASLSTTSMGTPAPVRRSAMPAMRHVAVTTVSGWA